MWIELPNVWIVVLNVLVVPSIHLGVSWWFTRMPQAAFDAGSFLFRQRKWENGGAFYHAVFRIRQWKRLLPDAAPWFNGFAKRNLNEKDPEYLRAFRKETCRGEAAHYTQAVVLMVTLVWNPWPVAAVVMAVYAVLSNLPCILIQRFTRCRLNHLLTGLEKRS